MVVILLAVVASCLPSWAAPVIAQDIPWDLAAVMIHPDDLDWHVEQQRYPNQLRNTPYVLHASLNFTTIDEVLASPWYLRGRGGFVPAEAKSVDVADVLDSAGWSRTVDAFMVRKSVFEGTWVTGVGISIEEYESADGAEEAFAAFNDPEPLAEIAEAEGIEPLDAPGLGDEAAMWSFQSRHWIDPPKQVITLWVRADNLIISVSTVDATETTEPDPAVVERLMDFQLTRLDYAAQLYQPNLSGCAPRLAGDSTSPFYDHYNLLNGVPFGELSDTYTSLTETRAAAVRDGLVDRHRVVQAIGDSATAATANSELYYEAITRAFVDEVRAAEYMDDLESVLEKEGREQVAGLEDEPALGDDARGFTYLGYRGSTSTIVYVQQGNLVFSVDFGNATKSLSEPAWELAEAYLDRLEPGACSEPLETPDDL